jgi:arylsulfatase A-like enzyme
VDIGVMPVAAVGTAYHTAMKQVGPLVALLALCAARGGVESAAQAADASQAPASRPNVVWIVVDDMSPHFSSYGERLIETPHVDRLAREGTRFTRAFVTAPVCSPSRSALITGKYQTSIGAHHHRSGRGTEKITLPSGASPVPALFKRAGYYTAIGGPLVRGRDVLAKTDYNFEWDPSMYDGNDWSGRRPGQPFFMQVQLHGGKYRENQAWRPRVLKELGTATDPAAVTLPPYYPRDSVLLADWADYLDAVRYTDREVGEVVARLERERLLENTIVVFLTDHGISHAREKQFLYDGGTHVPLVVRGPGVPRGAVRDDLVEHIDVAATSLALAGLAVPETMDGRALLAKDYRARDAVFAARDRCDETVDRIRSVRTARFKYIRNFHPQRPHLQPNAYKDAKPIVQRLRELHGAGRLDALQTALLFSPVRAPEELYDLQADPHETRNLASVAEHRLTLETLRARLERWMRETRDAGREREPAAMFESDMAVYLEAGGGQRAERLQILRDNIALMKQWAAEGR